jgi:Zn-dependent protease/predicted transcriptional regulator
VLVGFVLLGKWRQGGDLGSAVGSVLFLLAIFATIVLHELGHALTARQFGIRTRDITLLPIGGIARLERMPDVPRHELWVALAGPAVNLAIAAIVFGFSTLAGMHPTIALAEASTGTIDRFIGINVWLAVFNLIPAFPMDGGRVLRALLAERMDYVRATQIAAFLGQGVALLFGFIGLFVNPFLLFIALLVWMGASDEAVAVQTRSALTGIPVTHAMMTDFRMLESGEPLDHAVALVLAGAQRDFPVTQNGRLVGVLTRDALVAALATGNADVPVAQVMDREFQTTDAQDLLDAAVQRLQGCRCQVLPVLQRGQVVGLLTPDNVGEFIMFRGAVGSLRPAATGASAS